MKIFVIILALDRRSSC